jgi:Sortase domain
MIFNAKKKDLLTLLIVIIISSIIGLGVGYAIQTKLISNSLNTTSSSVSSIAPQRIESKIVSSAIVSSSSIKPPEREKIVDRDGRKYTYLIKKSGIDSGFIWATDIRDLAQNQPFSNEIDPSLESKLPKQPQPLDEVVQSPKECKGNANDHIKGERNWLSFEKYSVEAPIMMASFQDFYIPDPKTGFVSLDNPIEESQYAIASGNYLSVPVQRLLTQGVVHLPTSPTPGQVGNSYIVGHTSNFPQVKSDYNRIFKSFEQKSKVGDEFTVWDHFCRKLKFRVFEALAIMAEDTETAYKSFGDKRVVTLQGSILELVNGTLQPTKRWLTRGELVLEKDSKTDNQSSNSKAN